MPDAVPARRKGGGRPRHTQQNEHKQPDAHTKALRRQMQSRQAGKHLPRACAGQHLFLPGHIQCYQPCQQQVFDLLPQKHRPLRQTELLFAVEQLFLNKPGKRPDGIAQAAEGAGVSTEKTVEKQGEAAQPQQGKCEAVHREHLARTGQSIVPTEKGLHIYDAVKDMLVADVSLTGSWEKTLLQIERHTLGPDTFMASITDYTRKATREILNLSLPAVAARTFTCPKCKTGHIIVREKSARCDNKGCGLTVYRRFLNKELTDQHLEQLFSSGSTRLIKGFKGKKGVAFDASVTFDAGFTLTLSFPKNGNGRKRKL